MPFFERIRLRSSQASQLLFDSISLSIVQAMRSSEWQRKAAIPEKGLATCKIKQEAITDNMISHLRSYFGHRISKIKIAEFIVPHSHFKSSFEILHYFFFIALNRCNISQRLNKHTVYHNKNEQFIIYEGDNSRSLNNFLTVWFSCTLDWHLCA